MATLWQEIAEIRFSLRALDRKLDAKFSEVLNKVLDHDIGVKAGLSEIRGVLETIGESVSKIESTVTPLSACSIAFFTTINGKLEEVRNMNLKVSQKLPIVLAIKDKFGNPAQVDGVPAWSLTDEAKGSLAVAEDGMSAEFVPAGQIGSFKVQVKADADLGEGVKEILGEMDLDLLPGEAVSVELAGGDPTDIVEQAPEAPEAPVEA